MLEGLDDARAMAGLVMLCGAALLDVQSRRVHNGYWIPFAGVAGLFLAAELATSNGDRLVLIQDAMAVALCGLFYLLWRFGLYGGADTKCLMVLALLEPAPAADGLPIPPSLGILLLGALFGALIPLGLAAWNLAHGHVRFPTLLLGIRMPLAAARARHVWPMQEVADDGAVRIRYDMRLRANQEERAQARYAALETAGVHDIWVTPKVPFVVPLTFGAVAWLWLRSLDVAGLLPR